MTVGARILAGIASMMMIAGGIAILVCGIKMAIISFTAQPLAVVTTDVAPDR